MVFELFQKLHLQIYVSQFMTFICSFESGKCEKEGKILQEFEYLKKEKRFLDKIKNIFHSS